MMHDSKSVARLFAAPFTVWAVLFIVLPLFFVCSLLIPAFAGTIMY